ncbi:MAG: RDD family protein [Nannocystaceae bacterium]|nr:RDD family protein [Nannocystaceae bacterium]
MYKRQLGHRLGHRRFVARMVCFGWTETLMRFWFKKRPKSERPGFDEILPPEGVPLYFEIATFGVRFGAQLIDILITSVAAIALLLFLGSIGLSAPGQMTAIASMLFFIIRIPYYVVSELLWNGQTLGKRMVKVKVISANSGSLTAQSLVVRNLMKEAEIFLPGTLLLSLTASSPIWSLISLAWIIGVIAVPLINRRSQRLGDIIAGTFVIHLPKPILLKDLVLSDAVKTQVKTTKFNFLDHQLEHYGAFELQTLEDLLRADTTVYNAATAKRVTRRLPLRPALGTSLGLPVRTSFAMRATA